MTFRLMEWIQSQRNKMNNYNIISSSNSKITSSQIKTCNALTLVLFIFSSVPTTKREKSWTPVTSSLDFNSFNHYMLNTNRLHQTILTRMRSLRKLTILQILHRNSRTSAKTNRTLKHWLKNTTIVLKKMLIVLWLAVPMINIKTT